MQDAELWVKELEEAGWKRYMGKSTIWQSPGGHLFRGPYKAWQIMKASSKRFTDTHGT